MKMRAPLTFAVALLAAQIALANGDVDAATVAVKIDALHIAQGCSDTDTVGIANDIGSGQLNCDFHSNGLEKNDAFASTAPLDGTDRKTLFDIGGTSPFQ